MEIYQQGPLILYIKEQSNVNELLWSKTTSSKYYSSEMTMLATMFLMPMSYDSDGKWLEIPALTA